MDILVGVHVGANWPNNVNCAKISLDDAAIKNILRLAKKAGENRTIIYDHTPELGWTELDMDTADDTSYRNFQEAEFVLMDQRSDVVELHVDGTDFWWEGLFKHTDTHWETRMIPLSFLPQPKVESGKKLQDLQLLDVELTAEGMNAIHNKIATGMAQGLNAREIDATFQRHVTKAQLIRCIVELIERGY